MIVAINHDCLDVGLERKCISFLNLLKISDAFSIACIFLSSDRFSLSVSSSSDSSSASVGMD